MAIGIPIFVGELIGGIYSGSLALLSDSGHVFVDQLAFLAAIWVAWLVYKNGHKSGELRRKGAYAQGGLLLLIAVSVAIGAWMRRNDPPHILTATMITVAVLGMIGNYVQHRVISSGEKHLTSKGLNWHVLSDFWQSVAVIVAGILIAVTGKPIIDIFISAVIAFVMLCWGIRMIYLAKTGSPVHNHGEHCDHHH